MKLPDRSHSGPRFTPAELRLLLESSDELVRVFSGMAPDPEYPYLVFPELSSSWYLADAWQINAAGVKNPELIRPTPVALSETRRIDVGDPQLRSPLEQYMRFWPQKATFVFARSRARSTHANLALGVGHDLEEARLDAISRLKLRNRGIGPSRVDEDSPAGLLRSLLDADMQVASVQPGAYISQEAMGHEYMSIETYMLAQEVSSDGRLDAQVEALDQFTPAAVRRLCLDFGRYANLRSPLIDWLEIAQSFSRTPHVENEVVAPVTRSGPTGLIEVARAQGISGREIELDVLGVLAECSTDGELVRLPKGRLNPKLYKRVDEVLRSLGGKWVGGKVQAHQFEEDPAPVLEVAVQTGTFVKPQDFGYFPTPADLVARVLPLAGITPGMRLLEPQAGTGAFALPMSELAGSKDLVTVCELLPGNAAKLRQLGFSDVREVDFLSIEPTPLFDRIVMNPPFNGGVDVDHVLHASRFLVPDGQLVAITGPSWEFNSSRKAQSFRDFVGEVDARVEKVESGAFKASGTNVATRVVSIDAENLPWNRSEVFTERQRA